MLVELDSTNRYEGEKPKEKSIKYIYFCNVNQIVLKTADIEKSLLGKLERIRINSPLNYFNFYK